MTLQRIYNNPQSGREITVATTNNVGNTATQKCIIEHSSQPMWETQPVLGNENTDKSQVDHAEEEKNTDFQTVREMSRPPVLKRKEDHSNTADHG